MEEFGRYSTPDVERELNRFTVIVIELYSKRNLNKLCDYLRKSLTVLVNYPRFLDIVLNRFPSKSLVTLIVLKVKLFCYSNDPSHIPTDAFEKSTLFTQIKDFIENCEANEIRCLPDIFADLCHLLTKLLVTAKTPIIGINLMSVAVKKLQENEGQLTVLHADLCQLCLLAKNFKPAITYLDFDVTSVFMKEGVEFDPVYYLLYFYYGGMIYTAVKNYDRGLYYFEATLTVPTKVVSQIMIEALKKYMLVSLILHGEFRLPLLPSVFSFIGEHLFSHVRVYIELDFFYSDAKCSEELQRFINLERIKSILMRDNNFGLAKKIVHSFKKHTIKELSKVFLTISLPDLAKRARLSGPAEVEKCVLEMIEDNELHAVIDQNEGIVKFQDDPDKFDSANMQRYLEAQAKRCMGLDEIIKQLNEKLKLDMPEEEDEDYDDDCLFQ